MLRVNSSSLLTPHVQVLQIFLKSQLIYIRLETLGHRMPPPAQRTSRKIPIIASVWRNGKIPLNFSCPHRDPEPKGDGRWFRMGAKPQGVWGTVVPSVVQGQSPGRGLETMASEAEEFLGSTPER